MKTACDNYETALTRRDLLAAGGTLIGMSKALAQVAINPRRESECVMVVLFLRGGADGLNMIAPYAEDAYYRLRPSLAIARPSSKVGRQDKLLDLDGYFGLHPKLEPLLPYFLDKQLSVVHAVGSQDRTRSHFEAMSAMERGVATAASTESSGWLARYLDATNASGPMRAVAFSSIMPDSLRGAPGAIAIESLADYKLQIPPSFEPTRVVDKIKSLHSHGDDQMSVAGRETLSVLESLRQVSLASVAQYPNTDLGRALNEVSVLIRSGVGLEIACLDVGGWDTHVVQGGSTGLQANLLDTLASAVAAFAQDLKERMKSVSVVIMTEFGRRVYENTGLGTDHGTASVMMVLGGGVQGGRIQGNWPGLKENDVDNDLAATTDYRTVLGDVLQGAMGFADRAAVFPGAPIGSGVIRYS